MAGGCYGRRRLSELLQEQQEPFLLLLPPLHGHGGGEAAPPCCSALGRAARRALRRWDPGYGCFPCGRREKFRWLPRGGDNGRHCDDDDDDELDGGDGAPQQLSPVSVLDVLQYDSDSDEEPSSSSSSSAPALSSWEEDDEDEKASTASGSSPPPAEQDDGLAGAREAMAALVELELSSGSTARQWRRLRRRLWEEEEAETEEAEASRVAESIEAMIFEEIRAEAVRDMTEFRF